jgi:Ca2+-binding RTX toxin-like protein
MSGSVNIIDLGTVAPAGGFRLEGGAAGDQAGYSVSSAGDINGDGFDDMIIGVQGSDAGGSSTGIAYVVFGRAGGTRPDIDLGNLAATDGFRLQGAAAWGNAELCVSSAGDLNGDGYGDLIIGAPWSDTGEGWAGAAYVIFGQAGPTRADIDVENLAAADGFRLRAEAAGDRAGHSVASAGDVNGDGYDDLIVGAPWNDAGGNDAGATYVIYGQAGSTRSDIDLGGLDAADGFRMLGAAADRAGFSASSAGDINGDGYDDLIIGAHGSNAGGSYAGAAYVIFGQAGGTRADIDLGSLAATDGFRVQAVAGDQAGWSVSQAGDINGDGLDDLIIGAQGNNAGGSYAGAAYVIFGQAGGARADIDLGNLAAADGFRLLGPAAGDRAGWSVSSAGDINADGYADLIVGAPWSNAGGNDSGAAYVIFGQAGGTRADIDLGSLSSIDGFLLQGAAAWDNAGFSVASAGDVNGDGYDDLIVGAYGSDAGGTDAGAAYVIYGSAAAQVTGTSGNDTLSGGNGDNQISGLAGNDYLYGNGGDDRLDGGAGTDRLYGGAGADRFVFAPGGGLDIVYDFELGIDRIEVVGYTAPELSILAYGTSDAELRSLDGTRMVLRGIAPAQLTGTSIEGVTLGGPLTGTGGNDTLTGTGGADQISGLAGNDYLYGNGGDDRLDGGAGTDRLYGGAGADRFVFAPGGGLDIVYDFELGIDRIEVVGYTAPELSILAYGASDAELRSLDGTRMVLRGIDPMMIELGDFLFS